jgi:hypothetical protein
MADSPNERRRRAKADAPRSPAPRTEPADADDADGDTDDTARPARAAAPEGARVPLAHRAVWPLITGLAVGFAVGRESYRFGPGGAAGPEASASPSAGAIAPDKKPAYAKMSDFPSGWLKDTDIGNGATLLAGLTDPQKIAVMQAMNERNCECGCGMGSLATCLQKDPNCPRSPVMAKLAVDLVKQGKGVAEIEAAIDAQQKAGAKPAAAAAPEVPPGPKYIELAAWNPRKGSQPARVTVVEFSDFQ